MPKLHIERWREEGRTSTRAVVQWWPKTLSNAKLNKMLARVGNKTGTFVFDDHLNYEEYDDA